MKTIHVLVEGQSEEIVVRDLLQPHFGRQGLHVQPVLARTKREKDGTTFKGGISSFGKIERDLKLLLGDTSAVAITTFLDYYALPSDFPGLGDRPSANAVARVQHVERAFAARISDKRFIPHLTLHELEAWVYIEPSAAPVLTRVASKLESIRNSCGGPEEIDEGPETAPSKRILKLVPDYAKTVDGPAAIQSIGLARIREACPHTNNWLRRLEKLAASG